ncbi:MAG: hypothetical protein Q7S37_03530 [bacterium]|nr:hypothetical protein [bacterium]
MALPEDELSLIMKQIMYPQSGANKSSNNYNPPPMVSSPHLSGTDRPFLVVAIEE